MADHTDRPVAPGTDSAAQKRTIRPPQGVSPSEQHGYFMIANQDAAIAIAHKLSGAQMRLWMYLMMVDRFADCTSDGERIYHDIPNPSEIATCLGMSVGRVEKDIRVLRKLRLYDYRIQSWQGHNLAAAKARREADRMRQHKQPPPPKPTFAYSQQLLLNDGQISPEDSQISPYSQQQELNDRQISPNGSQNCPHSQESNLNDGQISPQNGQNRPDDGQNCPKSKAETIEKSGVSDSPQTIQTNQTLSLFDQRESEREKKEELIAFIASRHPDAIHKRAYALRCLEHDREYWQSEFEKHQNALQQVNVPPPPVQPVENVQPMTVSDRVAYYQALLMGPQRGRVEQQLKAHPEWGLAIVENRIVICTAEEGNHDTPG